MEGFGTIRAVGAAIALVVFSALLSGCGAGSSPPAGGVALKRGGELAAWSPNGRLLAAPATGEIDLVGLDGAPVRQLAVPGVRSPTWPCECRLGWSEDGRRILFVTRRGPKGTPSTVGSVGLAGGSVRREDLGVPAGNAAWSPRGWPLVFAANSGAYELNTPQRGPRPDLWRLDGLGGRPRRILSQPGSELRPQISPDGTKVLYVRKYKGRRNVWVVNLDGSNPHPVTSGLLIASAVWAPDSKDIAVSGFSARGQGSRLYVEPASGPRRNPLRGVSDVSDGLAWTPNGRWIAYGALDGTIWRIRPDGRDRERIGSLPHHDIRRLLYSPDGRHLAYAAVKVEELD
jgi:Tol biopolymer transport system component